MKGTKYCCLLQQFKFPYFVGIGPSFPSWLVRPLSLPSHHQLLAKYCSLLLSRSIVHLIIWKMQCSNNLYIINNQLSYNYHIAEYKRWKWSLLYFTDLLEGLGYVVMSITTIMWVKCLLIFTKRPQIWIMQFIRSCYHVAILTVCDFPIFCTPLSNQYVTWQSISNFSIKYVTS